jgi:hypothetical protein
LPLAVDCRLLWLLLVVDDAVLCRSAWLPLVVEDAVL